MKKLIMTEMIRRSIPDISWIRRSVTHFRIHLLYRNIIPTTKSELLLDNPALKRAFVSEWENRHPAHAKRLNAEISNITAKNPSVFHDENSEDFLVELKFCKYAYGFLPYEFICYDLFSKTFEERRQFVSDLERIKMVYQMNDIAEVGLFMDKAKTFDIFKNYYHRECIAIEKRGDFPAFLNFIHSHPQFVKKQVFESIGNSVELIDINADVRSELELFDALIKNGKHILEEKIEQSPELSAFNSSSVNTIRCITAKTKNGIAIPSCFLKVGRAGSFVDNGGAGGILIGVDKETGELQTEGVDEYAIRYKEHPDSGLAFQGKLLPDWVQLRKMCIEMAEKVERVQFIGWDLAHTSDHGWVVVEGNGGSQFVGPQCTFVTGIRQTMETLMSQMELFS